MKVKKCFHFENEIKRYNQYSLLFIEGILKKCGFSFTLRYVLSEEVIDFSKVLKRVVDETPFS
jgi:hypothetical protein